MASIAPIVIRVIELLGKWNKFMCVMFCSVVAGRKNLDFFRLKRDQGNQ
jgi:hypothetical protein